MDSRTVRIIDQDETVVATAQVAEQGGRYAGWIELGPMPTSLRRTFEEYEEIVNGQMFGLLDAIESRIDAIPLKAVFEEGAEAIVGDLQIYPGTGRVSFRLLTEAVRSTSLAA